MVGSEVSEGICWKGDTAFHIFENHHLVLLSLFAGIQHTQFLHGTSYENVASIFLYKYILIY